MGLGLARPLLQHLVAATGESVNLGVRRGPDVLVLQWVESPHPLRFDQPPGSHVPIHTSAMGKALLAFSGEPAEVVRQLPKLVAYTPRTISRRRALVEELARIRERGWAMNDEERNLGVRAIGAPVLGSDGIARAAISLQGPTVRLTPDRVEELVARVLDTAARLRMVLPVDRL
jgi:IclR family acetate operon transcriptional repressor